MAEEIPTALSTLESAYDDFMRRGYVVLPDILDESTVAELRQVIDDNAPVTTSNKKGGGRMPNPKATSTRKKQKNKHQVYKRVFEDHPDLCLRVFKNASILPLVTHLLGCCGSARGREDSCLRTHVIHNNAYRIDPGTRGQAPNWHTDDAPTFQTSDGKPLPDNVVVAPLVLTCIYFLNDLQSPGDGGTRIIDNSHRFGGVCTNETAAKYDHLFTRCPKGSVLIISSHTWHRGSAVESGSQSRYAFQVTYGRRLIGHKHGSIMNYNLSRQVENVLVTEDDRRLMGFLQGGPYS